MKKLLTFLLVGIFIIGTLSGCSNSDTTDKESTAKGSIEEIKERGVIKVGVFSDKPPFGYVDSSGKNQGFDVFIAKRFAKDLLGDESKVEFVLVEAANRVSFLESNKVDIIMANFTVTDERKEKVDFANPYMKVSLGLVSPDGDQITSVDQLKGKKLVVNKGTTAETYFLKNHPDIELLKFEQNTEAFEALKDNRGAALAHDNTEVLAWAKSNPGFTVGIPSLGGEETIAPAVQKGNTELLEWINSELEIIGKEDFIYKAYVETLKPVYGDSVSPDELVIESGKTK